MLSVPIFLLALGLTSASDYFLHFTDEHLEWGYVENSDPGGCSYCRSDKPGNSGHFGDLLCQSPEALLEATLAEAARLFPSPQFIIVSGDFRRGYSKTRSKEEVIDAMTNGTQRYQKYFPSVQVWPTFGNHDTWPNDFHDPGVTWLYEAASKLWSPLWLDASAALSLRQNAGCYESWPSDGSYGVVMINSCLWYNLNNVTKGMDDPGGAFAWMEKVLGAAMKRGVRAYVVGHCLPNTGLHPNHYDRWSKIIVKYAPAIEASFYGHVHTDYVQVYYDKPGWRAADAKPIGVGYVAPSVTPSPGGPHGHNPAFRAFRRNPKSSALLSHETYYLDLDEANRKLKATFVREYGTTDETIPALTVPSPMTPTGWNDLVQRVATDEAAFGELWSRFAVRSIFPGDTCDETCKRQILCQMRYSIDKSGHAKCMKDGF